MDKISLENVSKSYDGKTMSVDNFNLSISEGEFIVIVGPSGCGKSTTLRMIAGLENITDGKIKINGKIVNDVLPKDRDLAMVFQNYALYPHMSVYENIAYPLKIKKFKKDSIRQKVMEAAELLNIKGYLDKKPKELSGGQKQRVALGRCIVRNPKAFLMDEPLSNLDAKLRTKMRTEIINLQKSLNKVFIYVTHDQTEAMTMGDRIVVMDKGKIMQVASPKEIYTNPLNKFVADFIGSPPMNFIDGNLVELPTKGDYEVGFRPEDIKFTKADGLVLEAELKSIEVLGAENLVYTKVLGQDIIVRDFNDTNLEINKKYPITIPYDKIYLFDKKTGERINL
ncbi:MAG: sn-glycerol-3-phosphate ABC transporter ATP-binding protein UgpC [Finegoldia sp.]|nr:sn-glycerol-3-phosphate ABC transporter ATP-binding protein UgpC [Finegoldia sp.]